MSHFNTQVTSVRKFFLLFHSFFGSLLANIDAFPQIHARGECLRQCEAVGQSRGHCLTNQPTSLSGSEGSDGGGGQGKRFGGCQVPAQSVRSNNGKKNLHYKKRRLSVYF